MRTPRLDKDGMKQGAWTAEEDQKLIDYITRYRIWNWGCVAKFSGLSRNGKSCRLRWVNYLNPAIKRGNITKEEEQIIVDMYTKMGSRWSTIAKKLPGRTDNEIKNYWYTRLKKRSNEKSTQRREPLAVEILTLEHNIEIADVSNNIAPASSSETSNSLPASNNIQTMASCSEASNLPASDNFPMIPHTIVDEPSFSSTGFSECLDIQEVDEASTHDLLINPIEDSENFWTHPYFAGNMFLENDQQRAYVQEWPYQEPLSSYGLFNDEYWLSEFVLDESMYGAELPGIYLKE